MALKSRDADIEAVRELKLAKEKIFSEIAKIIIGQDHIIENALITLLSRGLRGYCFCQNKI